MARTTALFLFLNLIFAGSGCVTVKLGSEGGKRADGVKVSEPSSPFVSDDRNEVDAAWKNVKTGNVISYISDCQDPTDPPLDQITNGVIGALSDLKVLEEQTTTVQEREGRRVHASGKVDGVPTEIDILAFKRNHCIYILSYVGVKKAFPEDRPAFAKFIDGFKAP